MSDQTAPAYAPLRLAADEADQVPRLQEFLRLHPEVDIVRAGPWRAVIPEPHGETVVCRYTLRELLDRLDGLLAGDGS